MGGSEDSAGFDGFDSDVDEGSERIGLGGLKGSDSSGFDGFDWSEFCWTRPKGFDGA